MDSRNPEKCHTFPQKQIGRVRVPRNGPFPVHPVRGGHCSAPVEAGIFAAVDDVARRGQISNLSP
ncbi:MAG: hypothetical protein Q8M86_03875 [Syntrophales bacterium]|nr:hypothetical protein [Syntrophales bacterium]